MDPQGLHKHTPRPHPRVQRSNGILKDGLNPQSESSKVGPLQARDVLAIKPDVSGGRTNQAKDAAAQSGLARTALPDEAERLPFPDVETHIIHGMDGSAPEETFASREVFREVLDSDKAQPLTFS
jgi:hypothetical protein